MRSVVFYVKDELSFARELYIENRAGFQLCVQLALRYSVSHFFFCDLSPLSSLCSIFYAISSNIDEILSIIVIRNR